MTPRIQKAIDIFLDAIIEGTLAKGTCVACAVGNLVAHGLGGKIYEYANSFICDKENSTWALIFSTSNGKQSVRTTSHNLLEKIEKQISFTDFSKEELMKIEYAFETNTKIHFNHYDLFNKEEIRADQIRGLEAVVKVMLEFDEQEDNVKEVFTEKAEAIPV